MATTEAEKWFQFITHSPNFNLNATEWTDGRTVCQKMCLNPLVTIDLVLAHPEFPWDNACLYTNPSISMEDVINHPELPQDYYYFVMNPNLTMDFVLAHPEIDWPFIYLAQNPMNQQKEDNEHNYVLK